MTEAALERTGRSIVLGTWGCAVITMAGSAASGAVAYDHLGEHWGLGLATGIAVDVALCVALVGDRRLYTHGLSSPWGRALRITTAAMSLVLNSGVAFATGRYFLAFLHAFLPVLLVVLTEYGQDVLLRFSELVRAREAERQAEPVAPVHPLPPAPERLIPAVHAGVGSPLRTDPPTGPIPVRSGPVNRSAPRPGTGSERPRTRDGSTSRTGPVGSPDRSDEQLGEQVREMARADGPLTVYAVRQALGVGHKRAARLLAQLESSPADRKVS